MAELNWEEVLLIGKGPLWRKKWHMLDEVEQLYGQKRQPNVNLASGTANQ